MRESVGNASATGTRRWEPCDGMTAVVRTWVDQTLLISTAHKQEGSKHQLRQLRMNPEESTLVLKVQRKSRSASLLGRSHSLVQPDHIPLNILLEERVSQCVHTHAPIDFHLEIDKAVSE